MVIKYLISCKKTSKLIFLKIEEIIFSLKTVNAYKVLTSDFSRKRKQSFSSTVLFLVNLSTKSLSLEIENFVGLFKIYLDIKSFTKSAFVQYRKKLKPDIFRDLAMVIVNEFYTDNELGVKLWNGFRLLAVDGSRLTLPNTEKLKQIYGQTKNQQNVGVVQGRISVLYDVINKYVIDGILTPLAIGNPELPVYRVSYVCYQ